MKKLIESTHRFDASSEDFKKKCLDVLDRLIAKAYPELESIYPPSLLFNPTMTGVPSGDKTKEYKKAIYELDKDLYDVLLNLNGFETNTTFGDRTRDRAQNPAYKNEPSSIRNARNPYERNKLERFLQSHSYGKFTPGIYNKDLPMRLHNKEMEELKKRPNLPESVECPFNGMSVSQMRFLNEEMMGNSRYSVSFRGGALDPHPISIEVDADCEQTALEMAVAKLEKEYEGRCLIDPQEVENGGDDYNEDNALYIDATMEGASQPWYVDPQMVHIEELPPRGYDSDGYDSMDDNALPEDF